MGSFHCHISLPEGRLLGGQAADQSLEEELGKLKKASEEADGIWWDTMGYDGTRGGEGCRFHMIFASFDNF